MSQLKKTSNIGSSESNTSSHSELISNNELSILRENRKITRSKITRKFNTIVENVNEIGPSEFDDYLEDIDILKEKIKIENEKIYQLLMTHVTDRSIWDNEIESCDMYDDKILQALRLIRKRKSVLAMSSNVVGVDPQNEPRNNIPMSNSNVSNQLKLPQLPLPEYGKLKGESLDKFFRNFEVIIDKYGLSSYEKFVFLMKQLHNEPLTLVRSLQGSQQSYEVAKELLLNAFAQPIKQKFDIINRLANLKFDSNTNAYEFISEIRVIIDTFENLKIDIQSLLQYFIWNAMNGTMKSIFVQIVNNSFPTLEQIQKHIFEATERYLSTTPKVGVRSNKSHESTSNSSSSSSTIGMAANVEYSSEKRKFRSCILCTRSNVLNVNHPIFKCDKFASPREKLDKLKQLNICTKCGNEGHETSKCKFRFAKSCRFCNRYHFSYLCPSHNDVNSSQNNPTSSDQSERSVSNHAATLNGDEVCLLRLSDVLLPTFSCVLPNGENMRGLKDSGSQANFVSDSVLKNCRYKVIKNNHKLTVDGMNISQPYITRIVQIPLTFGEKTHNINAICVPKIRTKINAPGLKDIVQHFISKGYTLADKFLTESEEISNIEFILGADANHCIPETTIVFGNNGESTFSKTHMGTLLYGSTNRLVNDLRSLPPVARKRTKFNTTNVSSNVIQISNSDVENFNVTHSSILEFPEVVNCSHISVLDDNGNLIDSELSKALSEVSNENFLLSPECSHCANDTNDDESISIIDKDAVKYVLDNTSRNEDGRLKMPLIWNEPVRHLLGQNLNLSRKILNSNRKKLSNDDKISMVDKVFKDQEELGVIERIENVDQFVSEHPEASFIAHMPIFKPGRLTSKVRLVYLSNLCEKKNDQNVTLSHNQCILPGPCLNNKIVTSLIEMRFDKYLAIFDLVKAFLQIDLSSEDSNKLCFLWYKCCAKNNFDIVAYKSKRLMFGLRCSPTILMLAMYRILILDAVNDPVELADLKLSIYSKMYMDNGGVSADTSEELRKHIGKLDGIFNAYCFPLQQFVTNDSDLQSDLDEKCNVETPQVNSLLGLNWDRVHDTLSTRKLRLDASADTKRKILSSIASNFDLFNFNYGPLLNRARIFMHVLQGDKSGWDSKIDTTKRHEWKNICKQINDAPVISIPRFIGDKSSSYELVTFTDSSKLIIGCVVYLRNIYDGKMHFLLAKNRILNKNSVTRSIPNLELHAIDLGLGIMFDLLHELSGKTCVKPLKIEKLRLFTDSLVCISWLDSYVNKLDKMRNRSTFAMNRLKHISQLCEEMPVSFGFCAGTSNPADCITRPLSYKCLMKSNYFTGPVDLLQSVESDSDDVPVVVIPNPLMKQTSSAQCCLASSGEMHDVPVHLFDIKRCSSFSKIHRIYTNVLNFINNLKSSIKTKKPDKYKNLVVVPMEDRSNVALKLLISRDQNTHFPEIRNYFSFDNPKISDIPNLMSQLNIFVDSENLLRVKCKLGRFKDGNKYPLLLSKKSHLSEKIIHDLHVNMKHAGIYTIIGELRRKYWILHAFSLTRRILRNCIRCKRFNSRTVKLNQSDYRMFRLDPPNIPFRYCFLDHFGPIHVKISDKKEKVYVLILSCLWSRVINLKLCSDLSLPQFLRSFQMHIFEYGVPEIVFSDLGSQIVAGGNLIMDFLRDAETQKYFKDHGMQTLSFQQYSKGRSELGSLIEICVKMVKKLINASIGRNVLDFSDFEFLLAEVNHIVNRRPIALREVLRENVTNNDLPSPITPEMLLKGLELPSLNVIPQLQSDSVSDPSWLEESDHTKIIKNSFSKLNQARIRLNEKYHTEFQTTLIGQSTSAKGKYCPVKHDCLKIGDVVLLKEIHTKAVNYPLALVKNVTMNDLGEVTDVEVLKGSTRETLKRHVTSVIPLLTTDKDEAPQQADLADPDVNNLQDPNDVQRRSVRTAARTSNEKTKKLFSDGAA